MNETLKITCIQADLVWEDTTKNLDNFTNKIDGLNESTDIIVLQEMFTTGFTMTPKKVAQTMKGTTVQWMLRVAKQNSCVVMGSTIIAVEDAIYNRCLVALPSGDVKHYDKRHLFTFAGEHLQYKSGTERLVFDYKGFRICPLICYDLRFPVWARNTQDIDVLIYMANWPKPRIQAWDTLLQARAIENLCYSFGVNRVGKDANNLDYVGHTVGFDYFGQEILTTPQSQEAIATVEISKKDLLKMRENFRFLEDRDSFELKHVSRL